MISTTDEINKIFLELEKHSIATALDLGCGKGRIAMPLAKKGVKVLGVDIRASLISHENFKFVNADVRNFDFNEKFDLIICSLLLHFFRKEKSLEIIKKMQQATSIGGINLIICMSNEDALSKEKPENFYPSLNMLKEVYQNWKIVSELQDFTEIENHDNLGEHRHNLIILLLEKLSNV